MDCVRKSHVSIFNCPWEQKRKKKKILPGESCYPLSVCVVVRFPSTPGRTGQGVGRSHPLHPPPSLGRAGRVGLAELWGPPYLIRAWHKHWLHTSGEWSLCHNTALRKNKINTWEGERRGWWGGEIREQVGGRVKLCKTKSAGERWRMKQSDKPPQVDYYWVSPKSISPNNIQVLLWLWWLFFTGV